MLMSILAYFVGFAQPGFAISSKFGAIERTGGLTI